MKWLYHFPRLSRAHVATGVVRLLHKCAYSKVYFRCSTSRLTLPIRKPFQMLQTRNVHSVIKDVRLLYADCPLLHSRRGVGMAASDEAIQLLTKSKTEELMNKIKSTLTSESVTAAQLSQFVLDIQRSRYQELAYVPWLHSENSAIAFMQILMNQKLDVFFGPILNHEAMELLTKTLSERFDEICDADCPQTLLSLIYLGVEHTHPLVNKFLIRLLDSVHLMDLKQLELLNECLRSFKRGHVQIIQKMILRMQEIIDQNLFVQDKDFILNFCFVHIYLAPYMSKELSEVFAAHLHSIQQNATTLSDPSHVGVCLRYARKIQSHCSRDSVIGIAQTATQYIPEMIDNLQSNNVAELCHNMKKLGLFKGQVAQMLQQKSVTALQSHNNENLRIRDIVNYSFAFTRESSGSLKRMLCSLWLERIDEMDVLILSNLADILFELNIHDPVLMSAYKTRALVLFDNLSAFITRFAKVLRLLSWRPIENEAFRAQFFEKLMKLIDGQYGRSCWSLAVIVQYLLPTVKEVIPRSLMDTILASIPQCHFGLVLLMLDGLNNMQGPWMRQLHNQVLELRISMLKSIWARIETVQNVGRMAQMILGVHRRSSNKDMALIDKMMARIPQISQNLNQSQFISLTRIMKKLDYHNPEIFEELVRYMSENRYDMELRFSRELIRLLSQAGYTPHDAGGFTEVCVETMEKVLTEKDTISHITLALDLCQLQIYPDSCLAKMFTFDYLEAVDDQIATVSPELKSFVEDLMMRLNRHVVLECPHLDVPWFHEDYCFEKSMLEKNKAYSYRALEQQIEECLCEEFGGTFFQAGVYTPYYHRLDFECLLDKNDKLVAHEDVDPKNRNYQRVAILILDEAQYCNNSRHMKGVHFSKLRHLELMGYKVVTIPFYEWRSMAMSDPLEKAGYLREKIFSG